ncbi:unnamed protein product [Mytilus edulis]|uniref:Uncharacterized protein n=1 Tax=Mytilus edulis TaxID=6550 RepID=A0A8S3V3Z1_MYTED|nr:unnamed protein product [Mytilus edulis]
MKQLNDNIHYTQLSEANTLGISKTIENKINELHLKGYVDDTTRNYLNSKKEKQTDGNNREVEAEVEDNNRHMMNHNVGDVDKLDIIKEVVVKPSKKEPPKPAPRVLRKPTIDYPESSDEDIIDVLLEPFVEDDSDSTVTSDIIQPVMNPTSDVETEDESESEGDAHSHDTNGTDSDIGDRRPSPEVTSDNQEDSSDSSSSSSPVSIRRSTRARKAPAWMTSGKYELSKSASHTTTTDWFQRVQCLTSLADTRLFHGKQAEAAQAIIEGFIYITIIELR